MSLFASMVPDLVTVAADAGGACSCVCVRCSRPGLSDSHAHRDRAGHQPSVRRAVARCPCTTFWCACLFSTCHTVCHDVYVQVPMCRRHLSLLFALWSPWWMCHWQTLLPLSPAPAWSLLRRRSSVPLRCVRPLALALCRCVVRQCAPLRVMLRVRWYVVGAPRPSATCAGCTRLDRGRACVLCLRGGVPVPAGGWPRAAAPALCAYITVCASARAQCVCAGGGGAGKQRLAQVCRLRGAASDAWWARASACVGGPGQPGCAAHRRGRNDHCGPRSCGARCLARRCPRSATSGAVMPARRRGRRRGASRCARWRRRRELGWWATAAALCRTTWVVRSVRPRPAGISAADARSCDRTAFKFVLGVLEFRAIQATGGGAPAGATAAAEAATLVEDAGTAAFIALVLRLSESQVSGACCCGCCCTRAHGLLRA